MSELCSCVGRELESTTMSTPQRSRYPRPLKAMHAFAGGSSGQGQAQAQAQGGQLAQAHSGLASSTGGGGGVTSTPTAAGGGTAAAAAAAPFKAGGVHSPPPPTGNGVRRCQSSPEGRSLVSCSRGEGGNGLLCAAICGGGGNEYHLVHSWLMCVSGSNGCWLCSVLLV